MNSIKINFREPSVDRFAEILATGYALKIDLKGHIVNMPKGYVEFLKYISHPSWLDMHFVTRKEDADFVCEYPEKLNFSRCFDVPDEPGEVIKRMLAVRHLQDPVIDGPGMALLKNACEKLNLNRDQLRKTIDLAYVIACMDKAKSIEAHHVAEAIQYLPQKTALESVYTEQEVLQLLKEYYVFVQDPNSCEDFLGWYNRVKKK